MQAKILIFKNKYFDFSLGPVNYYVLQLSNCKNYDAIVH